MEVTNMHDEAREILRSGSLCRNLRHHHHDVIATGQLVGDMGLLFFVVESSVW